MDKNYTINGYELDKAQMELINSNTNTIVIAGAGSGKTFTILAKMQHLIANNYCKENEMLVISFTNASVNDIKKRIKYNIDVYTFHKLAMEMLNKANYNYKICSSNLLDYITSEFLLTCPQKDQNTILNFLNLNIKYPNFLKTRYYNSFCNMIVTFINLYKTNNMKYDDIKIIKYTKIEKKILTIIFKIYKSYLLEKKSANSLDFDDLIIEATHIVKKINLNYKYIIIDEFQDTSYIRLNLIKEIYTYTNSKIIVVGDDYQSIYRFSGCNLGIFLNFDNLFPNVKRIKLINTYRNSLDLISIAATFIQKNPLQIKKNLISSKRCENPIVFVPYGNKIQALKNTLNKLLNISHDIMILSRNNKDIYNYIDIDYSLDNNNLTYKNNTIKYYTIHKSKGLEAEYVIVINCDNDYLGFPNKIENNSLINKLFPDKEIKYAEERRLFYVAITRCKEKTFLLYNKSNPSIFIKEIKRIAKKTKLP